tara:strand:+ start:257 stop:1039 length:783 start_codon:yes stop_codon:yes gene_type:complete
MNQEYNLTSRDYADLLGITTETLRTRRRRETEKNFIIDEHGKYWWKRDRPIQGQKETNVLSVPGPSSLKPVAKSKNRGAMLRGEKSDYPNWQMEERNKVLALGKITKTMTSELINEVTPEVIKIAKERVAAKKEKEFKRAYSNTDPSAINVPYGIDRTPLKYGTMLKASGLDLKSREADAAKSLQWRNETDVKFLNKPGTYKVPDFSSPPAPRNYDYYGIGSEQDDNVEVPGVYEGVDYSTERTFKNKIEEEIWRLKNKR